MIGECVLEEEHVPAALGYYRATLGDGKRDPELATLQQRMGSEFPSQPMLYIHGEDCGCIGIEVAKAAQATAPAHVRFEYVSNAGHFVHVEQPERVNRLIVDFLAS